MKNRISIYTQHWKIIYWVYFTYVSRKILRFLVRWRNLKRVITYVGGEKAQTSPCFPQAKKKSLIWLYLSFVLANHSDFGFACSLCFFVLEDCFPLHSICTHLKYTLSLIFTYVYTHETIITTTKIMNTTVTPRCFLGPCVISPSQATHATTPTNFPRTPMTCRRSNVYFL